MQIKTALVRRPFADTTFTKIPTFSLSLLPFLPLSLAPLFPCIHSSLPCSHIIQTSFPIPVITTCTHTQPSPSPFFPISPPLILSTPADSTFPLPSSPSSFVTLLPSHPQPTHYIPASCFPFWSYSCWAYSWHSFLTPNFAVCSALSPSSDADPPTCLVSPFLPSLRLPSFFFPFILSFPSSSVPPTLPPASSVFTMDKTRPSE